MTLNSLTSEFVTRFQTLLPEDRFRPVEARYLEEPRGRWAGRAGLVALPRSTEEVAQLVRLASELSIGVLPYGGGTGLVGGQILEDGPIPLVLSLERMAAIRDVHADENVLVCEAGAILADVQAAADAAERLFPLSLASEGSARIGGLLATNAGGTGVLRYGNARDLCLGVEAVLPSGETLRGLSRLRKDNTGYDLRHLLLGAEGTLGVITAASLKLSPRPDVWGAALISVRDPAAALRLLGLARDIVGEGVSAFELIHAQGFKFLEETRLPVRNPWAETPQWCVLIDLGLPKGGSATVGLERIFEAGLEDGLAEDGLIAQNTAQRADFWAIREHIPEANRLIGAIASSDVSLPLGSIAAFIEEGKARLTRVGAFRINCFGHVGDGNLHFNVFPMPGRSPKDHIADRDKVQNVLHELVAEMDGSVSAEHGIGRLKVGDLERYGDPTKLAAMRAIKGVLDPKGIMNPGAVLRM